LRLESSINLIQEFFTKQEVEIINLNIDIKPDSEQYLGNPIVYLKINNQEIKDIRDCCATIKRLDYKQILSESNKERYQKDYIWQDWLVVSNLNRNSLSWSVTCPHNMYQFL